MSFNMDNGGGQSGGTLFRKAEDYRGQPRNADGTFARGRQNRKGPKLVQQGGPPTAAEKPDYLPGDGLFGES